MCGAAKGSKDQASLSIQEQELRLAQEKFEASLDETERAMTNLLENEVPPLSPLSMRLSLSLSLPPFLYLRPSIPASPLPVLFIQHSSIHHRVYRLVHLRADVQC